MNEREALKLALEAFGEIEWSNNSQWQSDRAKVAITAIKESLANVATNDTSQERVDKTSVNVHEPVQWGVDWGRAGDSPCVSIIKRLPDGRIEVVAVEYGPQRTWVGLTKTVVGNYLRLHALGDQPTFRQGFKEGAAFAEAKLKEKNS